MSQQLTISKRNGLVEILSAEKYNRVVEWGVEGIPGVSASAIAIGAINQIRDGMSTLELHDILTKTAADMISADTPNYSKVAARLNMFKIRKDAFGQYAYPKFYEHIKKLADSRIYDPEILESYSKEDIDVLEMFMISERDNLFEYAATVQIRGKYLCQDRTTKVKRLFEAPQQMYMLIAMCTFQNFVDGEKYFPVFGGLQKKYVTRLDMVKGFYDIISTFKLSLPTPVMSGVRTKMRQFSSCVLIECGDSIGSINASSTAIVDYISQRAGIGLGIGNIRGVNAKIRGGEVSHSGIVPFIRLFQSAVKSCSQGGVRGGAATLFYPIWHYEMESLIQMKNNRGTEENRAVHLDYCVQLTSFFYERRQNGQSITLFSPEDVPDLLQAFYSNKTLFKELYEKYERDDSIRKITVSSVDLFLTIMSERLSTGRIYIANMDHINTHSSFNPEVAPIRQSNLCVEITLPTKPLAFPNDPNGEIALCTLSAFNLGAITDLNELCEVAFYAVSGLDSLLDYQNYPMAAAEGPSKDRRSLGIGVTNLAYWLAKHGFKYSGVRGNKLIHETFEAVQYYLLNASCALSEMYGPCRLFHETKYSMGLLPIDHYYKGLDNPRYGAKHSLLLDWEELRQNIALYGLRNSTLSAQMPCETSSQVTNSTNGIEPPRAADSIKSSKDGTPNIIVPDWENLKDSYEFLWSMINNRGYLIKCGIIQKFFDQSISTNTNYDPSSFEDEKLPMNIVMDDLFLAYDLGIKTLYYSNTRDRAGSRIEDCGACKL